MCRIDDDRQMRFRLQNWNSAQIERVARGSLKRADAALTEDHIGVTLAQDVFGAHYQIINRGAESPLEHHGKSAASDFLQQREIVHVASANLKTIRVLFDHRQIAGVHHFRNHREAGFRAGFSEKSQSIFTQSLKTVRRSARLKCASAENL